jgi:hypothetical protein
MNTPLFTCRVIDNVSPGFLISPKQQTTRRKTYYPIPHYINSIYGFECIVPMKKNETIYDLNKYGISELVILKETKAVTKAL